MPFWTPTPRILELRLTVPPPLSLLDVLAANDGPPQVKAEKPYEPLVAISFLEGGRESAKQSLDPIGVFYRTVEFDFPKEGQNYRLEAYSPVINEDEYLFFLRITGISLGALLLITLILLLIPNREATDPQYQSKESRVEERQDSLRASKLESTGPVSSYQPPPPRSSAGSGMNSTQQAQAESASTQRAQDSPSKGIWQSSESQDKLYAPTGLSHSWFMIPRMDNELSRAGSFSLDLSVVVFDSAELQERDLRFKVAHKIIDFFTYKDMCFEGMGNRIWVMIPSQRLEIALRTVEEFLAELSSASLPSLYAGVASRSGRLMSGEGLAEEAEKALEKAIGSMDRVVGFKADPDRYRNFLAGK
jgi:hypothetical protein